MRMQRRVLSLARVTFVSVMLLVYAGLVQAQALWVIKPVRALPSKRIRPARQLPLKPPVLPILKRKLTSFRQMVRA